MSHYVLAAATLQDAVQPAVNAGTLSAGRLGAITAALFGLVGVIAGWLALMRPASRLGIGSGTLGAKIALAAGLVSLAVGGVVVATSDEGIGTGNGRAGAYVALIVGLISVALGWRAMTRTRHHQGAREGSPNSSIGATSLAKACVM